MSLMLQSKSVLGHTRVVLGPLRLFLSVYDVIRVECLFVYYVVSMCMHFFLIAPSPCDRAAPHVTASGEAPRSGSGGSCSLGDLQNHPSPTHLMSDLRGRQTATTDQTTPSGCSSDHTWGNHIWGKQLCIAALCIRLRLEPVVLPFLCFRKP